MRGNEWEGAKGLSTWGLSFRKVPNTPKSKSGSAHIRLIFPAVKISTLSVSQTPHRTYLVIYEMVRRFALLLTVVAQYVALGLCGDIGYRCVKHQPKETNGNFQRATSRGL